MSYKMVFRSLQEVFPQVDLRLLKAVALEHSKDVDAAVEFVLSEVLPSLLEFTDTFYTSDDTHGRENSHADVWEQHILLGNQVAEEDNRNLLPESSIACDSDSHGDHTHAAASCFPSICNFSDNSNAKEDEMHCPAGVGMLPRLASVTAPADDTTDSFNIKSHDFNDKADTTSNAYTSNQFISNDELVSISSSAYVGRQTVSNEDSEEQFTSIQYNYRPFEAVEGDGYADVHANVQEMNGAEATDQHFPSLQKNMNFLIQSEKSVSKDLLRDDMHAFDNLETYESCPNAITSIQEMPSFSEDTSHLQHGEHFDEANDSLFTDFEDECSRGISAKSSKSILETDMTSLDAKPPGVGTQSGRGVAMEVLQDFISDVKSNKETLVLSFESIKNTGKEVELLEDTTRQAKEAASKAGHDILMKAEDMKEMLIHAKETKEMQAAEVYGEKSILATEAQELQARLLNLSDQRDRSLSIIEEIQRTLEMRLAAAKEVQMAAEKEKLEKEEAAHKILKEQEAIMEEVVQESKRLQQEGQENAKLRAFLMEGSRIIDTLQGEMTVISEDIMLLKERVDGCLPLSGSLRLTSSSLASLSSALQSQNPVIHVASGESQEKATGDPLIKIHLQSDTRGDREIDSHDVCDNNFPDDDWVHFG